MSINQTFAHHNTFSKNRIDFTLNEEFNSNDFQQKTSRSKSCGVLSINNNEYNMSISEIETLIETLNSAKEVILKKYKLGIMIK